jgi:aminoglycoside phosphotransferase (APT) family kinase protein
VKELENWPEEWARYIDKLKHEQEELLDRLKETVRPSETGINVLAHGDLWVNNVLFNEQQAAVRFVDFQFVKFTSPAIDLHLFLHTSATLDVRVNHTDTLLQVRAAKRRQRLVFMSRPTAMFITTATSTSLPPTRPFSRRDVYAHIS